MPVGHVYVFFGEMSISVFCPFFNWVVYFPLFSCMSYLYILEINPLLVTSFANIFSHSVGCLFILFMVSFAVQKHLIRFHLFIFAFVSIALGDQSKKILLWFMSKSVLPMFSLMSFIISSLTCRSLTYFEFCFCICC